MVRRCLPRFALAAILAACGTSDADPKPPPEPPDIPDASSDTSIAFEDSTLFLNPGEPREVYVVVSPPDRRRVRFALLGESLDASLDADEKTTGADGRTSVTLTAPGGSTSFRLRASTDDASTELPVSVSGEGFASVHVVPSYIGIRTTPTWTASAVTRATCSDLPGMPPQEGPIIGFGMGDAPPVLVGLPVGPPIAITLRSARAVAGCTNVADLEAGETRQLTVKVSDLPVDVAATDFDLLMQMTPDGSSAWPLFDAQTNAYLDHFLTAHESESKQLLDTMQEQVSQSSAFAQARTAGGWDALLAAWLDEGGQHIRERVRAWIELGFEPLRSGQALSGRLVATPEGSHANLALDTFHGLPIDAAGIPQDHIVSLAVEPGDLMIVGGTVSCLPSRLIAAAAGQGAAAKVGTQHVVEALAGLIGCSDIAALFESVAPLPAACGPVCIEAACESALGALWNHAKTSSTSTFDTVELSFTLSGEATVNGETVAVAFDATWAGTQKHAGEEVVVKGTAVGGNAVPRTP